MLQLTNFLGITYWKCILENTILLKPLCNGNINNSEQNVSTTWSPLVEGGRELSVKGIQRW